MVDPTRLHLVDADRARQEIRAEERSRGIPAASLLDFGPAQTTRMPFLDGLSMPAQGAVVIGARTAGGKTSFMVNTAAEYLAQGRSVDVVSYEMSAQDIGLALALNLYARGKTEPVPGWNRNDPGPGFRIYDLEELDRSLPPLAVDDDPDFVDLPSRIRLYIAEHGEPPAPLKSAYDQIKGLMVAGKLRIHDGMGDINELAQYIRSTGFDVYVVDYLQIIPAAFETGTYRDVQSVCNVIRELVNQDHKLLILGAQFNRTMGDESTRDSFDPRPDQFREAGDIEQVATLAIGIGYQTDEEGRKHFFYKVLKNRFAGRMAGAKLVSAGYFDFYFAVRGGRWTLPEKWPKPPRKMGGNQVIVVNAIRAHGGAASKADLVAALEAEGVRGDNLGQTLKSAALRDRVTVGDDGLYHLRE